MSESKHTPGPWRVVDTDKIVGPHGNVVAECCGYSDRATDASQRAQGGRESNARLIAAAPDLLAALEAMLACVEAEWGADFLPYNLTETADVQANAAVLAARSALARARGA